MKIAAYDQRAFTQSPIGQAYQKVRDALVRAASLETEAEHNPQVSHKAVKEKWEDVITAEKEFRLRLHELTSGGAR